MSDHYDKKQQLLSSLKHNKDIATKPASCFDSKQKLLHEWTVVFITLLVFHNLTKNNKFSTQNNDKQLTQNVSVLSVMDPEEEKIAYTI